MSLNIDIRNNGVRHDGMRVPVIFVIINLSNLSDIYAIISSENLNEQYLGSCIHTSREKRVYAIYRENQHRTHIHGSNVKAHHTPWKA